MALDFERFLHLNSPLHRWHPAQKLIGLSALIFAFAVIEDIQLIPVMLGIALGLYGVSRLPLSLLGHQLRYPGLFMAGVVVLMPFLVGDTVVWQWGLLSLKTEGLHQATLIVSRFVAIFTLGVIVLGTSPFATTIKAMRGLGLPTVLADMILLSYRYLFEFSAMLATMQQAMQLRGFPSPRWGSGGRSMIASVRRYAALTGTMLIRSYEQAQYSYQAMCLRGYGQGLSTRNSGQASGPSASPDWWGRSALVVMLLVAGGFVVTSFY